MRRFFRSIIVHFVATIFLATLGGRAAHAKTYTITVSGTTNGVTEQSIGATEGCAGFNINEIVDVGLANYRLWAGMSRLEPVDDDGDYGSPTIDEIKNDPDDPPSVINWSAWDHQFHRADSYHFAPTCAPAAQVSLHDILAALKEHRIRAVVTLRNVDDQNQPPWAMRLNPPRTPDDWNEWWAHVFATVYWVNVRNNLEVHDWQVHNEPDAGRQGWGGTLDDYIVFTRKTHEAIQYVYDRYLPPGTTFRLYAPVAKGMNAWVEKSLEENDDIIEVVDWHSYSSSHYDDAVQAHAWIAMHDSDNVHEATYLSEWGSYRSAYGFSNALTYAKNLIEHSRDTAGYVTGSAIFAFYDWPTAKGVIRADGTKTPTYYALRMMIRGLQGGKTRYPVVHNIPSQIAIHPIAAVDTPSNILYVELINQTRQGHTIILDVSAHEPAGTVTFRRFAEGAYDVEGGTGTIPSGQVTFGLPGLTIMQVIVPLNNG
jgi:hypothetical protein